MDPVRTEVPLEVFPPPAGRDRESAMFAVDPGLRVVVLREIPDDAELRERWNALVFREKQPEVFYTWEWARAVQHAYRDQLKPMLFLGYEGQNLRAVAALAESDRGRITFLCATTADYCDFLGAAEDKAALVTRVLADLNRRDRQIVLTNLPADSDSVKTLRKAAKQSGYHVFEQIAYECAQVSLAQLERKSGQSEASVPGSKKARRALNVLSREAPVGVVHLRSGEAVARALPEFTQAHVGRFLITGRISNLVHAERQRFLSRLAALLCGQRWMTLTQITAGERAIAWNYGFQFAGKWFWYQPTFDSDFERHSPGFCLLTKIVEEAASDREMKVVDLGLGAEGYKEIFANQTRRTLQLTLNRAVVAHLRSEARARLATVVKKSSAVERGLRRLLLSQGHFQDRWKSSKPTESVKWLGRRACSTVFRRDRVNFYEVESGPPRGGEELDLKAIDWRVLAQAAMQNADDQGTLAYLLRCAQRLRAGSSRGFALRNAAGELLHLAWAAPFETFHCMEVGSKVPSVSPGSVVLFDCWTPTRQRGNGYYASAVTLAAAKIRREGSRCWIFSAAENAASVRGLEKAGFRHRFSITRQRLLGRQRIVRRDLPAETA